MAYMTVGAIDFAVALLGAVYPGFTEVIVLPEPSFEQRTIRALRIGKGSNAGNRKAVLFLGGVHARELINSDLLVGFAVRLLAAYNANTDLTLGGKTYTAATVRLVVEGMDIYLLPLVNPDGRAWVLNASGDRMWRKNRRPVPGSNAIGTDINRNFDFLWSSTIGQTSTNPFSEVYSGPAVFSESESRNVRALLDARPIQCMVDVHSYSEDILYPWGDDQNQSTNTSMNFLNPAYNGLRGTANDAYREYILSGDENRLKSTGQRVRDAIATARGRNYKLMQSFGLYGTSGTTDDYAFSRHFVNANQRKVDGYTLETGPWTGNGLTSFQPDYEEAKRIMNEVWPGLMEYCLATLCAVEQTAQGTGLEKRLDALRSFRDGAMSQSEIGQRYESLLLEHTPELLMVLGEDEALRAEAAKVLERVSRVVTSKGPRAETFEPALIADIERLLGRAHQSADAPLRRAITELRTDLPRWRGKTVQDGLKMPTHDKKPTPGQRRPKKA
jgi:murein tripeptide amidase MpaA